MNTGAIGERVGDTVTKPPLTELGGDHLASSAPKTSWGDRPAGSGGSQESRLGCVGEAEGFEPVA